MAIAERFENAAAYGAALHGDVCGYSRLTSDNEIETHHTLQTMRRHIEKEVATKAGEVVQFVADEFLAVFTAQRDALLAAIEIQRSIAAENQRLPDSRRMRFRLGANAGLLRVEDGQWYGDAINTAARLQSLAEPDGICASSAVLDAAGELGVRVRSLGKQRLKNIPDSVLVYHLVDDELQADSSKPWRRRVSTPSHPSLAVSPFVNLGGPDDAHFADGLMMSLIVDLMRIPGIDVVSENSTIGYRDQAFSAQQLGHELGVRYVLEGSVQRSGPRVRVVTQLLDVESRTTAWADRFEASIEDTFAAQDDIVASIVAALDVEVLGGESARLYRKQLDAETVEVLYRGWSEITKATAGAVRQAQAEFEEVIERVPGNAIGWALAAWSYFWAGYMGFVEDPAPSYARAEERARRAIELGDESGLATLILAHVLVQKRDFESALEAASTATDERPSCDVAFGIAASVMRYLGRWEEAIVLASRAMRLSPLYANWYQCVIANAYFIGRDYQMAASTAEGVVSEQADNIDALLTLAASQAALGFDRHAAATVDHARSKKPSLNAEALRRELPYRDECVLERFIEKLESAGLS